jgi:hypothetical protein
VVALQDKVFQNGNVIGAVPPDASMKILRPAARRRLVITGSRMRLSTSIGPSPHLLGAAREILGPAQPGVYVPAYLPHKEIDLPEDTEFTSVGVRSTPQPIVMNLPEEYGLPVGQGLEAQLQDC